MRRPIVENARAPGTDSMRRAGEHGSLDWRYAGAGEDRDAKQEPDGKGGRGLQHPVWRLDRSSKGKFRLTVAVEETPIGAHAALKGFPRLVECFDDRVVDSHGVGSGDEIADNIGLRHRIWHRGKAIETGARPAKLSDHDALARIGLAQPLIDLDRVIDGDRARQPLPVGQNMNGKVVDGRNELGMLKPDVPYLGRSDRHRNLALDLLNLGDEILNARPAMEDGVPIKRFVADDDAVDVAMMLAELDRSLDLSLVLLFPVIDPGAERHMQSELRGKLRDRLESIADAIGADGARVRRDHGKVRPDLLLARHVLLAVPAGCDGRERDAGELPDHARGRNLLVHKEPARRMQEGRERDHKDDTNATHFWESFSLIRLVRP